MDIIEEQKWQGQIQNTPTGPARMYQRPRKRFTAELCTLFLLFAGGANAGVSSRSKLMTGAVFARSTPAKPSLDIFQQQKQQQKLPSVQAILISRRINLLTLIRLSSLAFLLISLVKCFSDAGSPFKKSIWSQLHEGDMPMNFLPSNWELMLTRHSALPPPFLPSVQPLLAMLSSLVLYIGLGMLLPTWFGSSYRRWLEFRQILQEDLHLMATSRPVAVVVSLPRDMRVYAENKALLVCPLQITDQRKHYFDVFNQRYYFSPNNSTVVFGGPTLVNAPIKALLNNTGLQGARRKQAASEFQPYNQMEFPPPTISQALLARLASPLVVLQLFGKLLAALEDPSLLHTVMSLTQTLLHHYWNARQSIVSARELAQEVQQHDCQKIKVKVKRGTVKKQKWVTINANALLPGDIFQIQGQSSSAQQLMFPVDALLLHGSAVTNEAVLTGESVAQSKVALEEEPVSEDDDAESHNLDIMGRHRMSVLFAGTTLVHCPGPITLLVLRTGSYSSRGDLLRALQRSRVGAVSNFQTEQDGLCLTASLSVVACLCCSWYWRTHPLVLNDKGSGVSIFRKVLQCSRIILAAVPSELPMFLSEIARTCSMRLKNDAEVVCSEPGALLSASTIDHVLFDKTGTICSDTQSMSHVANASENADIVLAGSHSLVLVDEALVGDPLDLASLRSSGWTRDQTNGSYRKDGVTMWQIKTFPFDANRRTSSALVLIKDTKGGMRLCVLTKGSPDAILNLLSSMDAEAFQNTVAELGRDGYRIVAMGMKDFNENCTLFDQIFPSGFPNDTSIEKEIAEARTATQIKLHRDSIETVGSMEFCGFACFEASVRPNSPRVILELLRANVGVTMLTGDGTDVAISVARRCQIISEDEPIAVLDYNRESEIFVWTTLDDKKSSVGSSSPSTRMILASKDTYALVATGNAVEALCKPQTTTCTAEEDLIRDKLMDFVVFARATPTQKVLVVSALKQNGKLVMMCGDGVNDVAAIKAADCGVALLNGFGDHQVAACGNEIIDLEDERRRQNMLEKRIGSQRRTRPAGNPKLGKSGMSRRERVKALLDAELVAIKENVAKRDGHSDPRSQGNKATLNEIRETFAAIIRINSAENERATLMRKGGAAAAKILAEDDRNVKGHNQSEFIPVVQDIKPGEASLVAPFSCLRPAIDGVESILRYSVAASAFVHVMHKAIALNCVMSAFSLATVPASRLRYGKFMWNVEFALYLFAEQAATRAACTPRPRLSSERPPASFFHDPISIMTIIAQFFVHASTRTVGMTIATRLEAAFPQSLENPRLIRVAAPTSPSSIETKKPLIVLLKESLVNAPVVQESETNQNIPAIVKLFQRAPFRPNYPTNVAFLMSIFQSAVSTLVNHRGQPFHGAILEHRQLLVGIGLSILFPLCMLTDGFKLFNKILELRLLPSTRSQLCLLSVFGIDFIASYLVSITCNIGSVRRGKTERRMSFPPYDKDEADDTSFNPTSTAEHEEILLMEEAEENGALLRIITSAVGMIFLSSLAKILETGALSNTD